MMQNSVAFDRLSATGFCTAHVIDLVPAILCRTDVRLRNTPCLGRFERYRLTGPMYASQQSRAGLHCRVAETLFGPPRIPSLESSSFDQGVIRSVAAGRLLEEEDQREGEERQNHQQFEVVDVGDDLGLQCDGGVERGASGGGERTPQMRDGCVFDHAVDRSDVTA